MKRFFLVLFLAVLATAAWAAWGIFAPISPSSQTFVLLRPGYSPRRIARELESAGVIRSAKAFVLWHYLHPKGSLKAGEYLFEKTADARAIHSRLVRGDIYVHTVVIPEGYNLFDIAKAIDDAGLGSAEDFMKLTTTDVSAIADIAPEAKSLEGYLFPNTYQFTRTQNLPEIIATMVRQFRLVAQEIGLKSDVHKTVTMASIVEKETGVAEERRIVASVYYNRLAKRMALQADPTVIYGKLLQGTYSGALHHEDMRVESPYNTYRYPGLPPGPIGNPGKSSLLAAMHPATTNFFYFVSDGSGRHRFSHSLEEHNHNVTLYRKVALKR